MKTGNLDGQGIAELQNYNFQKLSSAPSTNLYEGRFYYNTADHTLYVYNGSNWINALTQGKTYLAGTGINSTALTSGTIAVDTTVIAQLSDIKDGATTIQRNGVAIGTITANQTSAATINITVPTTATDVGALPSTTTINDLTSAAQQAALNSGVTTTVVAQVTTNANNITTINGKIPSQATSSNQLADKAFVNSSVQTATANFRGNWATWSAVPTSANDYPEDYAGSKTPTVNDYLVVEDASGYTGETLTGTWRFKYTGTWSTDGKSGWLPEYQVNETPLTSAQLTALNSGITAAYVTQISTNTSAISELSTSKQDKLTAGSNIQINGTTISATDTTYSAGANIQINGTTISATDTTYVAGSGISITGNTISNTQTSAIWGNITGTLSNQTDLQNALNAKSTVTFVDWTA